VTSQSILCSCSTVMSACKQYMFPSNMVRYCPQTFERRKRRWNWKYIINNDIARRKASRTFCDVLLFVMFWCNCMMLRLHSEISSNSGTLYLNKNVYKRHTIKTKTLNNCHFHFYTYFRSSWFMFLCILEHWVHFSVFADELWVHRQITILQLMNYSSLQAPGV
jgi:hypothetical protein